MIHSASSRNSAEQPARGGPEYWRFCLDHVREYNHTYNFFAGMSAEDIVSLSGFRPWPALTGRSGSRYADAMARRDLIAEKLTKAFAPASLEVVDESHQHAGHAGHREGGETHFRVYIVAEAFRGKSRLERHRMINETLGGELEGGVHALAIHASAPDEGGA